jgi:predicted DNA-binding transcriptional regulator AlpA
MLTTAELAERWKMSKVTLTTWRQERRGPKFVKLGGAVRYPESEVVKFERGALQ